MADSERATSFIAWRLGFTGAGPAQSTPGRQNCQVRRWKVSFKLPPWGRNVFLPSLDPGRVYQITVQGTCKYAHKVGWIFKSYERHCADALYHTDVSCSFCEPHQWLTLDGMPIRCLFDGSAPEVMPRADRRAHEYSFRIDGRLQQLALRFGITTKKTAYKLKGRLKVILELLPPGTPSPLATRRAMQVAETEARLKSEADAKRVAEAARLQRDVEEKRAAAKDRKAREKARLEWLAAEELSRQTSEVAKNVAALAELHETLELLRLHAHWESHFMDPAFQAQVATLEREKMRSLKVEWQGLYFQFMQNAALKKLAENNAPEVIEWLEARVRIVQLAERLAVAPPAMIEKPKRKLKAPEFKQLMLHKESAQYDDKIARAKLKGKKIARAKTEMDALPLDDDERDQLKSGLIQSILEEKEEHGHGKTADTL